MRKALITGSQGFVGCYLRQELELNGYDVTGLDIQPGEKTMQADLLDADQLKTVVAQCAPDIVIHLAGQANVGLSWKIPQKTIEINLVGAINLMEAVRAYNPTVRMVLVGSSDQYGNLGEAGKLVSENLTMKPQSPYAVSKLAQEEMAGIYVRAYGMNICMTRSFNHGGAGQKEGFMIPDFSAGIVRVERGAAKEVRVGNLDAKRDFTHVKDIVRAYRLLAEQGHAGEVYNVGSGRTVSAQEILDRLCAMAECSVTVSTDPARMRPSDTPVICCNHNKLTQDTGWEPEYTIEDILVDTLNFYRAQYKEQ